MPSPSLPPTDRDRRERVREHMSDLIVELAFFLNSYAPLFAILAVRFRTTSVAVSCAALAAIGIFAGVLVLSRFRRVNTIPWTVRTVEDRGSEVAGYLATYLLPFVTVAEPGLRDIVGYGLFLTVVAVIYIRSDLIRVNPTLYLLGWRLYAIEIGQNWSGYLLARGAVARGTTLTAVRLSERLYVQYKPGERE
jgi:hypothetical protein